MTVYIFLSYTVGQHILQLIWNTQNMLSNSVGKVVSVYIFLSYTIGQHLPWPTLIWNTLDKMLSNGVRSVIIKLNTNLSPNVSRSFGCRFISEREKARLSSFLLEIKRQLWKHLLIIKFLVIGLSNEKNISRSSKKRARNVNVLVCCHNSLLYLTGAFLRFSNSNEGSIANSFPAPFRNALVHFAFLGFFFFLKFLWHFDRQNLKIWGKKYI